MAKTTKKKKSNKPDKHYTQKEIDGFIKDIIAWGHKGKGIYIASFIYETYKKPKSWLHNLSRHHPDLKLALEESKELLSARIANHCFLGDRNTVFGMKLLKMFCPEFKKNAEWEAMLTKLEEEKQPTQIIISREV